MYICYLQSIKLLEYFEHAIALARRRDISAQKLLAPSTLLGRCVYLCPIVKVIIIL